MNQKPTRSMLPMYPYAPNPRRFFCSLLGISLLVLLPAQLKAASFTWGGGNATWSYTSTKGWNGGPPARGDRATISSGIVAATADNQQEGVAITVSGNSVFRNAGFFLSPGNLNFFNGGSVSLENTSHYANYGGGQLPTTIRVTGSAASGASLTGDATHAYWNVKDGTTFDVADVTANANADLTVSAGLKDAVGSPDTTWVSSSIVKNGAGTLRLNAANSYTRGTTVNGGVLSLGNSAALGSGEVRILKGAKIDLDFREKIPVDGLFLNGFAQSAGVYGAATHPLYFSGAGQLIVPKPFKNALADAPNDGMKNLPRMKYGFFVHYVWTGNAQVATVNADGSAPASLDDLANRFDAQGFADDLAKMQVEYVFFTAWHANMNCLWPSAAMNRWLTGHTSKRDVLGDMITAVKAKGIRVFIYTHCRDGHDLGPADQATTGWGGPGITPDPDWKRFNPKKWNDFINDIYGDLIKRYGSRIDGIWVDGAVPGATDYPRLRQTVKGQNPKLIMVVNYNTQLYHCDIGQVENWGGIFSQPGGAWPTHSKPMGIVMGGGWFASKPLGVNVVPFSAEEMFRYTVVQAGVNTDGGGVTWAAGPYAGGGWETGVVSTMQKVGRTIQPIRRSICNTLPSQSWVTPSGTTLNTLPGGFVATRSPDDGSEFIHVLNPPAGHAITLPAPADKRHYVSASLEASGHPVKLSQNTDGSLTLTLPPGDAWNALDTVITLTPAGHPQQRK